MLKQKTQDREVLESPGFSRGEDVKPIPTVGHQRDLGNSLLQSIVTCDKVEQKLCRFCLLGGKCQHRAIGLSRNA